jgi:hypothetical protein
MRCLGPLSACVIGPLVLTAGTATFLAALGCLTLGAWDWNGQRATREGEDAARPVGAAGRPTKKNDGPRGRGAAKRVGAL